MLSPTPEAAFAPATLAADLAAVQAILAEFFGSIAPGDWERRTEARPSGWTLRETLAHVTAIAEMFDRALAAALAGQPLGIPGLAERTDLAAYNRQEIAARAAVPPADLAAAFDAALGATAQRAAALGPADLARRVAIPAYNRPITVAELIGSQLGHPGIAHAAQLANGAGVPPLWTRYPPDLLQRQLTRFFHQMAYSYWPERGAGLHKSINIAARGPGGGRWQLRLAPAGGAAREGAARRPALRLWTPSADALCRLMTLQVSLPRAAMTGQILAWGDLRLGFRLPYLIIPT